MNFYTELLNSIPEDTVGNKIRKQRLLREISQKDLASYINVADETIDTYEYNRAFPSPQKLIKIAEYFKMSVEYFFDEYYKFVFGNYGEKIKEWREKNNLSVKAASKLIGINPNALSRWEKEIRCPDRVNYKKLIDVMHKAL